MQLQRWQRNVQKGVICTCKFGVLPYILKSYYIIHARACFDVKVVDDVLLCFFFFDILTFTRQAKHFYLDRALGGAFQSGDVFLLFITMSF